MALDKQLADLDGGSETMMLSQFDGFVAGLLTCPDLIMPGEWLPMVWGGEEEDSAPVFTKQKLKRLVTLIMAHYNDVADTLHSRPGKYTPIFDIDPDHDEIYWEPWIAGFGAAMSLRPAEWGRLLKGDSEAAVALAGLITLVAIDVGDSELPKDLAEELAASAPDLIPMCVETLHEWRLTQHQLHPTANDPPAAPKVGRNDPCPCGSGKKYKKCCGLQ
ncbi:MAG TPA: UPF0149 family protein [Phenylobacterium sp.]|jgi:uncharacterized protein